MLDELLLISGNDIPFSQAQVSVHQPTLKEIAYITEKTFWFACELLKFNKNLLTQEQQKNMQSFSNFSIIMTMVLDKQNIEAKRAKVSLMSLLSLLFPEYSIDFNNEAIMLLKSETEYYIINEKNFEIFKNILSEMFCLTEGKKQYDPSGDLAKKIANDLLKAKRKKAKLEPKSEKKISFFSKYISILAIAKQKSINQIMDYTVYQLMDEFNRFMLYYQNEQWTRFKIAGATGMKDPQDWFKDIHQ